MGHKTGGPSCSLRIVGLMLKYTSPYSVRLAGPVTDAQLTVTLAVYGECPPAGARLSPTLHWGWKGYPPLLRLVWTVGVCLPLPGGWGGLCQPPGASSFQGPGWERMLKLGTRRCSGCASPGGAVPEQPGLGAASGPGLGARAAASSPSPGCQGAWPRLPAAPIGSSQPMWTISSSASSASHPAPAQVVGPCPLLLPRNAGMMLTWSRPGSDIPGAEISPLHGSLKFPHQILGLGELP